MLGDKIKDMLRQGRKYSEIMKELNVASSTISYHAKRIGLNRFSYEHKEHDWNEIQRLCDEGLSFHSIEKIVGINRHTLSDAKKNGKITLSENRNSYLNRVRYVPEEVLIVDSPCSTSRIKKVIKRNSLLKYYCSNEECMLYGIENPIWAGKKIVLHLDHINGIRNDHRIENLRWLCPNCHSLTETYCGKNKRNKK